MPDESLHGLAPLVVVRHAPTPGVLVYAGGFGARDDVHLVHLPLAIIAALLVIIRGTRMLLSGKETTRPAAVLGRMSLVSGYLLAESVMAEGFGAHLLHDPWILLAPAGLWLAHLITLAFGLAAVRLRNWMREPNRSDPTVACRLSRRFRVRRLRGTEGVGAVLGRAPPVAAAGHDTHDVLHEARAVLRDTHHIDHATLQVEAPAHADCADCSETW